MSSCDRDVAPGRRSFLIRVEFPWPYSVPNAFSIAASVRLHHSIRRGSRIASAHSCVCFSHNARPQPEAVFCQTLCLARSVPVLCCSASLSHRPDNPSSMSLLSLFLFRWPSLGVLPSSSLGPFRACFLLSLLLNVCVLVLLLQALVAAAPMALDSDGAGARGYDQGSPMPTTAEQRSWGTQLGMLET